MKKLFFLLLTAAVLHSCDQVDGSGNMITEKRTASGFKGVSVSNAITVELKTGDFSVEAEADDNLMKFVRTDVRDNVLRVYLDNEISISNHHIKVYVSAPTYTVLKASSAATLESKNPITADQKIEVNASSAGSVTAELDAPAVSAESSSGSHIRLSGRTKNFSASGSSGASITAKDLLSENTEAETSSGADISVHASVSIKASASGGGNVSYRGGAEPTMVQESSGGNVHKEN